MSEIIYKQLPLNFGESTIPTLDNFWPGPNAPVIHELDLFLKQIQNAQSEKCFYLWGSGETGLSHLLQAICFHTQETGKLAAYLPLEQYNDWSLECFDGLDEVDMLCLDNIEAIASEPNWQEAVFDCFNRRREANRAIIITGHAAPAVTNLSLPDLKSRLSWGLVFELKALSDDDKVSMLQFRAEKSGLIISQDSIKFIMHHCSRNTKILIGMLKKLEESSLMMQRKITIPFIKELFNI